MRLVRKKRRPPVGARPGIIMPDIHGASPKISIIDYSEKEISERAVASVKELESYLTTGTITWIDVQGLGDAVVLQELGDLLGIHPLALADVVNVPSRSKVEFFDDVLLIILDMVSCSESAEIQHEQISLFIGSGFVLTFQERYGDDFNPVRQRLRESKGLIRRQGSDFLATAILDTIVDAFFPVLERLGETLEVLEEEVINGATEKTVSNIYKARRDLISIRRSVWPLRESLSMLSREEHGLLKNNTRVYIRDVYDHAVQILDIVETYRELCMGFTDVYLSSASNRMNEVMKVLTVISTLFMPLSFFAGVYGMNFDHMPELHWRYGYLLFWGCILVVTAIMLRMFTRLGWISFPSWIGGKKQK